MTTTRLSHGRGVTRHLAGVDVVLLDLGLPDMDGVDVCREIRAACDVPVIVVSARGEVDDRIQGLHCGADDYLVKPFDTGELLARMHAVLRRRAPAPAPGDPGEVVTVADVRVDLRRHEVTVAGRSVALTRKEFQILALLAAAGGTVCTRGRIVAEVLVGLLAHDPQGFLRQQPGWMPEGLRAETAGHFTLGDILRFGTIGQ